MGRKKIIVGPILEVAGLAIPQWNELWEPVPNGFKECQRHLRHKIGIWAAKKGDDFFYIAAAANMRGSGISGGLARVYVQNPSGDGGWGLKKVRQNRFEMEAYIISMDRSQDNIKIIGILKKAMLQYHKPKWNQSEEAIDMARNQSYENRAKG